MVKNFLNATVLRTLIGRRAILPVRCPALKKRITDYPPGSQKSDALRSVACLPYPFLDDCQTTEHILTSILEMPQSRAKPELLGQTCRAAACLTAWRWYVDKTMPSETIIMGTSLAAGAYWVIECKVRKNKTELTIGNTICALLAGAIIGCLLNVAYQILTSH